MKKIRNIVLAIGCFLVSHSCFDLTEEVFSDLDSNLYYENEGSIKGVISEIYYCSFNNYNDSFWYLQEFSADQVNWRSWNNGLWGYSEGKRLMISTQNWTSEASLIKEAWEKAWEAIGLCNSALDDFEKLDPEKLNITPEKLEEYKAEVRTLRAWDYYRVYEVWGGALPLSTSITAELPFSADPDFDKGCKVIYDFLIRELDESLSALPVKSVNRMNQAMNRMLKARLLINSEVFTQEPRFTECRELCQEILDGTYGDYAVAADYRDVVGPENHTCEEVIMAFACDDSHMNASNLRNMPFLPYNSTFFLYTTPFDVDGDGWNSVCLSPSYDNSASIYDGGTPRCFLDPPYNDKLGAVYERFHDKDIRKSNFVFDFTTNTWSGWFLRGEIRANYGTGEPLVDTVERDGEPLILTDQVGPFAVQGQGTSRELEDVMSPRWGESVSGVRLIKYPILPSASGMDFREPDEVEFRITEAVFMLAECKMRAGDADGAKELVNSVRQRYFLPEDWATVKDDPGRIHTAFDMDWLLDQWGQEFLCEGYRRRTDLRRFDKFTQGQWWFFGRATDDGFTYPARRDRKYEWFPLPEIALSSNPNLTQNPDY
ncbi:MAG: RagB/SusD family nutrient uptake outer membrane protein [Bacteroides sp.]|nr:RagB/SusD family nutrient uptake outer membrane protein [Bacteroides sp.]